MPIDALKDRIAPFAKDVRMNLAALAEDDSFTDQQKYGLFLACGHASRNRELAAAMERAATEHLSPEARDAARAATAVMAMNNVYYRFLGLVSNKDYKSMPARLRMTVIGKPGVDKADFELWCLAVSAINGCASCVDAHEHALREAGVSAAAIQNAVRYAAILQSVAVALEASAAIA